MSLCYILEHIIELDSKTSATTLYSNVMEETGRLGIDVFVDNGRMSQLAFVQYV